MLGSSLSFINCYLFEYHRTDVESFPTVVEMIKQIAFSMIIEDTAVYWIHRSFHHPKLYPWIHKKHHEFYQSISIATEYAHPIEFILQNTLTIIIYAKIVGAQMHLATLQFWLVMRVAEAIETHSGYEFPWSPFRLLPFSSSSECHNYHHSHNIGNFESFFSFWDTICGTNISYIKHRNLIEEEAKRQIEKENLIQRKQK